MNVWIIDDDEHSRLSYRLDIREMYPKWNFYLAASLFGVAGFPRPDYLVVDISAVSPILVGRDTAYAPICNIVDKHPGCTVVISSAVGRGYAEDVKEDILCCIPDAHVDIPDDGSGNQFFALRDYFARIEKSG